MLYQSDGVDIGGSGVHNYKHYRIGKDVVARLEFITAKETKARSLHTGFLPLLATHLHSDQAAEDMSKFIVIGTSCL